MKPTARPRAMATGAWIHRMSRSWRAALNNSARRCHSAINSAFPLVSAARIIRSNLAVLRASQARLVRHTAPAGT